MRKIFWRDRRGATAVMFGIMAVPVLLGVGLSVDYATMAKDREIVQGIADRALLASTMKTKGSDAAVTASIKAQIEAAKKSKAIGVIDSVHVTFPAKDRIALTVKSHTPTTIMNLIADRLSYVVTSEAVFGLPGDLEVAIALDTTGSMSGSKLEAAKAAANELVDLLGGTRGARVRFAVVPFAQYVNVGTFAKTPAWLEPPAAERETKNICRKSPATVCTSKPVEFTADGVKVTYDVETCNWQPGDCKDETITKEWSGCVGSRNHPLNLEAGGDASSKIPGVVADCGVTMLPLTTDVGAVKRQIGALWPGWETYIPSGLLWGFNMLSPGARLSQADDFDPDGVNARPLKALVLMTDGDNTKSATFPKHDGVNKGKANDTTADLCRNIKAKKIAIYTVAFQVPDQNTKSLLQECASSDQTYFDATDAAALLDAFSEIAQSLKKIRLSR